MGATATLRTGLNRTARLVELCTNRSRNQRLPVTRVVTGRGKEDSGELQ